MSKKKVMKCKVSSGSVLNTEHLKLKTPIGRKLVLRLSDGAQYVGTVLDAAGKKAKRIRIQSPGARQGDVVMPTEYVALEYI